LYEWSGEGTPLLLQMQSKDRREDRREDVCDERRTVRREEEEREGWRDQK